MVNSSFIRPSSQHWQDASNDQWCPVCGAEAAETIGNGNAHPVSTGVMEISEGVDLLNNRAHSPEQRDIYA